MIAEFNSRLAAETENLRLDPGILRRGVVALLRDKLKGRYYVAEVDGVVVGQVMITYEWSDWRNSDIWWLQSVYVEEGFRCNGVFTALFKHLKSVARSRRSVWGLRLYMHEENARARRAYSHLGMTPTPYRVLEADLSASSPAGKRIVRKSSNS